MPHHVGWHGEASALLMRQNQEGGEGLGRSPLCGSQGKGRWSTVGSFRLASLNNSRLWDTGVPLAVQYLALGGFRAGKFALMRESWMKDVLNLHRRVTLPSCLLSLGIN